MPRVRVEAVSFPLSFDPVRIAGLDFARHFTAHLSRGYELDIEIIDGRPQCVAIRNPSGITSTQGLRDDLGSLAGLVKTAAEGAQQRPGDKQLRPLRRSGLAQSHKALKRQHYDAAYHRRVLDTAAEAQARGIRQDEWVMLELGLRSMATGRTHISRARDALGER